MTTFLKARFADLLAYLARAVVAKYRPTIVMVTGSVGKTSTKDAVAAALAHHYYLRASEKSYNSEFGVPLTIFGVKNPWHSLASWLAVLRQALALILLPSHYPNLLVLEVGADRPGDLAKILRIASPDAVVLTRLPDVPVHVEAYATPEEVRTEEFSPAYALAPGAPLIIPADDPHAAELAARVPARVLSYGYAKGASAHLGKAHFHTEAGRVTGMEAALTLAAGERAEKAQVLVQGSSGATQLLPAAAALALAHALGLPLAEALAALERYEPPAGRGRLLAGLGETTLIDDSYNASPAAVEEALENLRAFPHAARRIAILGDMLELGRYSAAEHARIGVLAADAADTIITIGIRAKALAESARAARKEDCVFSYDTAAEAAAALPSYVSTGDVILIKGSQSVRMERVVAALLASPADAARLVRQEPEWLKR